VFHVTSQHTMSRSAMADTLACRKGDTASTNPRAGPVVARLVIISIVAAAGDYWSDLLAESACINSSELVFLVGTRQSDDRQPFGLQ
jgi:hypothetical protein